MLKIEAGKYYRTRDGQKVGPMRFDETSQKYPWDIFSDLAGENGVPKRAGGLLWGAGGTCEEARDYDLIAEWSDAPDLTAITTPFGLLDRETQEALKAHGGPYQWVSGKAWCDWGGIYEIGTPEAHGHLTIRVKPAPPKPREWWVSGGNCLWDTYAEAYNACDRGERPVHVREVLE